MSPRLALMVTVAAIVLAATLYWKGRHDDAVRERTQIEAARAQATVARLETQGARDSAQRVELVVRQRDAAQDTVSQLAEKALTSEDGHAPLDPDRIARLRSADDGLCHAAPALAGCPPGGNAR